MHRFSFSALNKRKKTTNPVATSARPLHPMSFRSSPDCPSLKPTPTWACGPADHQGGLHTNADGRATHRFIGSSALIEHIKQTLISQSDRVPLFVCLFFCLFVCLLVGWLVGLLVWFGFSNLWRLFPCFCCCCKTGFHWVSRQSVLRSMSQCSTPTTTASLADCGSRHPRSTIIHHPIHLPSSFPPLLLLLHFRLLFNNAHPLSSLPRTRLWLSSLKSRSFYLSFSFFLSIYPSIHPSISLYLYLSLSLSHTRRGSQKKTLVGWFSFSRFVSNTNTRKWKKTVTTEIKDENPLKSTGFRSCKTGRRKMEDHETLLRNGT